MTNYNFEQNILQKKERKLQVLKTIYSLVDGDLEDITDKVDVMQIVDFKGEELIHVLEALQADGLIKGLSSFWSGSTGIKITNQGTKKVEAMYPDHEKFLEDERREYLILKTLYEQTAPPQNKSINSNELASLTGSPVNEVNEILKYLLTQPKLVSIPYIDSGYVINSDGIQKLRDYAHQLKEPNFQPSISIGGSNYAPLIAASKVERPNLTSTIDRSFNSNNADIFQAITELKQQIKELPQDLQDIADVTIDDLHEEISNPTKPAKLRALWMNICNIAAKAKDATTFLNTVLSLQDHLSKSNIDLSNIHLLDFLK
jgi:hypothetical protein